jgi:outer membrane protein assembly factor BamB
VPLRQYCQLLVARFPEAGLGVYRERVDPLAKVQYVEGVASRDERLLQTVVRDYFNSSYGDDALFALGEIALERGEPQKAFSLWEQISHKLRPAGGMPMWLAYPDTNLNLTDVRARLILASIMAGDLRWAKVELQSLAGQTPGAKGKLGGREVVYTEALAEMIEAAKSWPQPVERNRDWPTFTGSPSRQHVAPAVPEKIEYLASVPLPEQSVSTVSNVEEVQLVPVQDADGGIANNPVVVTKQDAKPLAALSYFPVASNDLVLVNTANEIFAYRADTGKPAWQGDSQKPGRIFSGGHERPVPGAPRPGRAVGSAASPQFTLTVCGRWLLARMGPPADPFPGRRRGGAIDGGYLVCLDLAAEGRLLWRLMPDDQRWAFEGTPICDGTNIYVAMRYHDGTAMPQMHVACFDLQTSSRRWRQLVCGAQSTRIGNDPSSNLLTLTGDSIYISTNLGAVASLDVADGAVRWLATYPRGPRDGAAAMQVAPLNSAIYDRGIVFAAPVDFDGVLAVDAFTGQFLWDSKEVAGDAELIGVSGGKLWAGGKSLTALDARSGKLEYQSASDAAGNSAIIGQGRGLLAGRNVYWPVKINSNDKDRPSEFQIRVIDAQAAKDISPPVRLSAFNSPCESGNLLATEKTIAIASSNRLMMFKFSQKDASTDSKD